MSSYPSSTRRQRGFSRRWHAMVAVVAWGCSDVAPTPLDDERDDDTALQQTESLTLHEVARQVTVSEGSRLTRLDAPSVEQGVGGAILLNSELVAGGTFVERGSSSMVEGGRIVGTMHGQCLTVGGGLSLSPSGPLGTVAKRYIPPTGKG